MSVQRTPASPAGSGVGRNAMSPIPEVRASSEDPDVILLSHVWFRRKPTGEEFSRETHAAFFVVLLIVFIFQCVAMSMPSMMRQNAVGTRNERCSSGCFRWQCGGESGSVDKSYCGEFNTLISLCKGFTIAHLVVHILAMVFQLAELGIPGVLSKRYRQIVTPLCVLSGMFLCLVVIVFQIQWAKTLCGAPVGDAYHLTWGIGLNIINSLVLFFLAHCIWTGNSRW